MGSIYAAHYRKPSGSGRRYNLVFRDLVTLAKGKHLFPFRTQKLSPSAPMVLVPRGTGRVGHCQFMLKPAARRVLTLYCRYYHPPPPPPPPPPSENPPPPEPELDGALDALLTADEILFIDVVKLVTLNDEKLPPLYQMG